MDNTDVKLITILRTAKEYRNRSLDERWKAYTELKQRLHDEQIFGREKDLADALNI